MPTSALNKIRYEMQGSTFKRDRLEEKYSSYFEKRQDYRQLVTYVPNKKLPVYNWFKYKEGFSRQLVLTLRKEMKRIFGRTISLSNKN